jgi:ABC-type sugar transport system substrate-binding protein
MESGSGVKLCHLYINEPDHVFDVGLRIEAERVAGELTRAGFPLEVVLRYALGDEKLQLEQIAADRHAPRRPDLFVIIPTNQDALHAIFTETMRDAATCVFLQQPLSPMLRSERASYKGRLFSVAADQIEIGRIQARQFAAILPNGAGSVLYVQGRQHSYATRHRIKGLLEELPRNAGLKLDGYRVYGDWTPNSVLPAVDGWVQLGGRLDWVHAAGAQSDDMALALAKLLRERNLQTPVIGVDGLEPGKKAVDAHVLAATVVQPLGVGHALRVFRDLANGAAEKDLVPEDGNIVLPPESYPPLDELRRRRPTS